MTDLVAAGPEVVQAEDDFVVNFDLAEPDEANDTLLAADGEPGNDSHDHYDELGYDELGDVPAQDDADTPSDDPDDGAMEHLPTEAVEVVENAPESLTVGFDEVFGLQPEDQESEHVEEEVVQLAGNGEDDEVRNEEEEEITYEDGEEIAEDELQHPSEHSEEQDATSDRPDEAGHDHADLDMNAAVVEAVDEDDHDADQKKDDSGDDGGDNGDDSKDGGNVWTEDNEGDTNMGGEGPHQDQGHDAYAGEENWNDEGPAADEHVSQDDSIYDSSDQHPTVVVAYIGQHFSLVAEPGNTNPDTFFFPTADCLDYPLSQLLAEMRDVIAEDIEAGNELLMNIRELSLEIRETSTKSFLDRVTCRDLLDLHTKLVSNDSPGSTRELHILLELHTNCVDRYQQLWDAAQAGRGLSDFFDYSEQSDPADHLSSHSTPEERHKGVSLDGESEEYENVALEETDGEDFHAADEEVHETPESPEFLADELGIPEVQTRTLHDESTDVTYDNEANVFSGQRAEEEDGHGDTLPQPHRSDWLDPTEEESEQAQDGPQLSGVEIVEEIVDIDIDLVANDTSTNLQSLPDHGEYDEHADHEEVGDDDIWNTQRPFAPLDDSSVPLDSHHTSATSTLNGDVAVPPATNPDDAIPEAQDASHLGDGQTHGLTELDWGNDDDDDGREEEGELSLEPNDSNSLSGKRGRDETDDGVGDDGDVKRRRT